VATLTIGRGADQLIQIPDARLAVAHATIEQRFGKLRLRVLVDEPVAVNDRLQTKAVLRRGHVLSVGHARLTVEDIRQDGVVVLRLDLHSDDISAEPPAPAAKTLLESGCAQLRRRGCWYSACWFSRCCCRCWRRGIRRCVQVCAMARWYQRCALAAGTLARRASIDRRNCNACHGAVFGPRRGPGLHHLPCGHSTPCPRRIAGTRALCRHALRGLPCGARQAEPAGRYRSRSCVACHGDLRKLDPNTPLQNVTDFGSGHPDFSLALLEPERVGGDTVWRTRMSPSGFRPRPKSIPT